jgi:hypothetical protein
VGRGRNAVELHVAILDHFVGEMLLNVNLLGALQSADDVVPLLALDARSVILVHRSRSVLGKTHILEEIAEVGHLCGRCRRRIVFRFCRG